MITLKLIDTYLARSGAPISNFFRKEISPRWYELIAPRVIDAITLKEIKHDFYLLVCSRECAEKPLRKMPKIDEKYTVIIREPKDRVHIKSEIQERVARVKAENRKDFQDQMSLYFLELR